MKKERQKDLGKRWNEKKQPGKRKSNLKVREEEEKLKKK